MSAMHNNEQTMEPVRTESNVATAVQQDIPGTSAVTAPPEQIGLPQTVTISTMQLLLFVGVVATALLLRWLRRIWLQRRPHGSVSAVTERYGIDDQMQHGQPEVRGNVPQFNTFRPLPHWNHTNEQDEKADTSKPVPAPKFEFDDEATQIVPAKSNRQILGHLVRVLNDPRMPAELPLCGTTSLSADEQTIGIGRHSKYNAVVIRDKSVSRQHAVVIQRGEQLWLRDNHSTTGTLLNWRRLPGNTEMPLQDKDILSFGEAVYEFRLQREDTDDLFTSVAPVGAHSRR